MILGIKICEYMGPCFYHVYAKFIEIMINSGIYTIKGEVNILPERVTKCLCSSEKLNIKGEASCSGLRLTSFEFEKGQEVQEKRHSNRERKARAAIGTQEAVKSSFHLDCQH